MSVSTVLTASPLISSLVSTGHFRRPHGQSPYGLKSASQADASCQCLLCRGSPRPPAEHRTFEQAVAHHPVAAVRPARDLAGRIKPFDRRLPLLVDQEPAVLVVEHRIGEDPL